MVVSKKQERKLNRELEWLVRHQELDKFNHNSASTTFLGFFAIALTTFAIFSSLGFLNLGAGLFATIIIVSYFTQIPKMSSANNHFRKRDKMIESRLMKLGVSRGDLEEEFRQVKLK